jgi:ABC-type uncharacterized transport system ATPase subunit
VDLLRAAKGRTSLLIAHRLSTVRHADKIVVMHQGRVEEEGSHGALLALGGRYAELWAMQVTLELSHHHNRDGHRHEVNLLLLAVSTLNLVAGGERALVGFLCKSMGRSKVVLISESLCNFCVCLLWAHAERRQRWRGGDRGRSDSFQVA